MKITVSQLRKIIKEEVSRIIEENINIDRMVLDEHYEVYQETTRSGAILYKVKFTAPKDLPRFIWVNPNGSWIGRNSKMLNDDIVASGNF